MSTINPTIARRLAITKQRLAGQPRPAATPIGIVGLVCDLGGLQLDPTSRVARSHWLVLWSRLGPFVPTHLDTECRPALAALAQEGIVTELHIADAGRQWPGPWYVHQDDRPLLERLASDEWQPRTTLLSPFDTLIYVRERTEQLFNFQYRLEIYIPKEKRQYGYFVMPILPPFCRQRKSLTAHKSRPAGVTRYSKRVM